MAAWAAGPPWSLICSSLSFSRSLLEMNLWGLLPYLGLYVGLESTSEKESSSSVWKAAPPKTLAPAAAASCFSLSLLLSYLPPCPWWSLPLLVQSATRPIRSFFPYGAYGTSFKWAGRVHGPHPLSLKGTSGTSKRILCLLKSGLSVMRSESAVATLYSVPFSLPLPPAPTSFWRGGSGGGPWEFPNGNFTSSARGEGHPPRQRASWAQGGSVERRAPSGRA